MKKILFSLFALSLCLMACDKQKDNSPAPVQTPPPVVCEAGYHKLPGTETCEKDPEQQTPTPVQVKKTITCGGFVIGGEKEFVDLKDLIDHAVAGNGTACLSYHENVIYHGDGFGPCITCVDIEQFKYRLDLNLKSCKN